MSDTSDRREIEEHEHLDAETLAEGPGAARPP
jgi:hypothetical protein